MLHDILINMYEDISVSRTAVENLAAAFANKNWLTKNLNDYKLTKRINLGLDSLLEQFSAGLKHFININGIDIDEIKGLTKKKYKLTEINVEDDKEFPAGTKFSKIVACFGKEARDKFSVLMSNKNNFTADLTLSFHPLDFITMSNASKYNSCYNINGQWRVSPLALLTDRCTGILYVSNKTEKFHNYKVPYKIWRALVHFHPEGFFSIGRCYSDTAFLKEAERLSADFFAKILGVSNYYEILDTSTDEDGEFCREDLVYKDPFSGHYKMQDLISNDSGYEPIGSDEIPCLLCGGWFEPGDSSDLECEYHNPCSECGEEGLELNSRGDCARCEELLTVECEDCKRRVYDDDAHTLRHHGGDSSTVCDSCFESNYTQCFWCGSYEPIYVQGGANNPTFGFLCNFCEEEGRGN